MQRLDLRPGQQAYVKVAALGSWASGGGDENPGWSRDTFYVYVMPPQVGEAELRPASARQRRRITRHRTADRAPPQKFSRLSTSSS